MYKEKGIMHTYTHIHVFSKVLWDKLILNH